MSEAKIAPVLGWMKQTDLVEVRWAKGGETLDLRIEAAEPDVVPPPALLPAAAPAVGVFRFSRPGRAKAAEKGQAVKRGERLGFVELGAKRSDVLAPADGSLVRILVEDGQAVEYGRPLFLVEPR